MEFLVKHQLLKRPTSQQRFRKARSCLTNLLCFLEKITKWLDDYSPMDINYLDFRKLSIKCHIKECYLKYKLMV